MKRIAIIGAGLAGLVLGKKLSKKLDVVIFEKSRGIGGRMSTRYADPFVFDHGAQYFTVRSKNFQMFLEPFIASGTIAEWKGKIINLEKGRKYTYDTHHEPYFVPAPNMNSLCKYLGTDLNINTQCEVVAIEMKNHKKWHLFTKDNHDLGCYDLVISTAPAPQTIKLFSDYIPIDSAIYTTKLDSCFALMVGINRPWDKDWIAANVSNSPIKWIGVNSTKPGRNPEVTCFVIHSQPTWTKSNLDGNIQEIQNFLLDEFFGITNLERQMPDYVSIHRWLYSYVEQLKNSGYYVNMNIGLGAVGDWCENAYIEKVWFYAQKLADFLTSKI